MTIRPTFQAMNNDIEFLFHQKFLQLLGPDTFGIEFLKRLHLVLVGHCADDLRFIFWTWCEGLEVLDDHVDRGDGELRAPCADVDDFHIFCGCHCRD